MAAETQDTDGETRWSHLKKMIAFAREHAEETRETVAAHMVGEIQKMMTGIEMDIPEAGKVEFTSEEVEVVREMAGCAAGGWIGILESVADRMQASAPTVCLTVPNPARDGLQRDLNAILDNRDGRTFEEAQAAVVARTLREAL